MTLRRTPIAPSTDATNRCTLGRMKRSCLIQTRGLAAMTAVILTTIAMPAEAREELLPPGIVARVAGRDMPLQGFHRALVKHSERDLKETKSGARAVLEQMIEERAVLLWCRANNVRIAKADVDARLQKFDREIRRHSGGQRTLRDEIKRRGNTEHEIRQQLVHELRKQAYANHKLGGTMPKDEHARIHQTKVVIAELRNKLTKVEYGLPMRDVESVTLPKDVVCRVNGDPITVAQFGKQLAIRLPSNEIREILDRECKIALMTSASIRLSDKELLEEIDVVRRLWPLERGIQREDIWRTVSFDDRFKALFKMTTKDVHASRFLRGQFGLIRKMRPAVTDEDVAKEFEERKSTMFGKQMLAADFRFAFAQKKQMFGGPKRSRNAAQREARQVLAWLESGMPLSEAMRRIGNRRDQFTTAMKVRLNNKGNDKLLYDAVAKLRDGEWSSPIETLSEVHILVRTGTQPARKRNEVAPLVRELLARRRAREWIEKRIKDPKIVRVRWPLDERRDTPPR